LNYLASRIKKVGEDAKMDANSLTDNSKFIFDCNGKPIDLTNEKDGKQTRACRFKDLS